MSRARGMAAWVTAAAITVLPSLAAACAVCGAGDKERSNLAFLISTIFLSLLPLAAIVGGLLWLRRHAREALAEEFLDRDDAGLARSGPVAGAPPA